tara:strand:- start:41 stop:259 length:219 start_codon:yes stop_codon:yes gene_type:complete
VYQIRDIKKTNIMTAFTFNTNIEKANKEIILEQCIELYNSNEFDFIVGGGTITGIKAMSQGVELFCMCNELN